MVVRSNWGRGEESGYRPTRALQRLDDTVKDDLAFLAGQGWTILSLTAMNGDVRREAAPVRALGFGTPDSIEPVQLSTGAPPGT